MARKFIYTPPAEPDNFAMWDRGWKLWIRLTHGQRDDMLTEYEKRHSDEILAALLTLTSAEYDRKIAHHYQMVQHIYKDVGVSLYTGKDGGELKGIYTRHIFEMQNEPDPETGGIYTLPVDNDGDYSHQDHDRVVLLAVDRQQPGERHPTVDDVLHISGAHFPNERPVLLRTHRHFGGKAVICKGAMMRVIGMRGIAYDGTALHPFESIANPAKVHYIQRMWESMGHSDDIEDLPEAE